jgi:hypothetical protein
MVTGQKYSGMFSTAVIDDAGFFQIIAMPTDTGYASLLYDMIQNKLIKFITIQLDNYTTIMPLFER